MNCCKCKEKLSKGSVFFSDDMKMFCLDCVKKFCWSCNNNGKSVYGKHKYNKYHLCDDCFSYTKSFIIKNKCDIIYSIFQFV